MKAPAFQFYAQDFLTGVTYLTNEEIGMYIKMLAKQWTDGKIPKKRLGFLVGMEWDKFSDELKSKFKDCGDFIINERLEVERNKKVNFYNKQRENGAKGGRPKKPKQNPIKSQKNPIEDEGEDEKEKEEEKEEENDYDINSIKADSFFYEQLQMNFKSRFESFDVKWDHVIEQFDLKIQGSELKDRPKTLNQLKARITKYLNTWIARLETESKNGKAKRANKGHRSTARVDTSRGPGKL